MNRVFAGKTLGEFDEEKFRRACILSGCDYLPDGLPNIGLKKAIKVFKCAMTNDVERVGVVPIVIVIKKFTGVFHYQQTFRLPAIRL